MKRECPMPARVFPLSRSILFVASCGAMNSAQLAGGGGVHTRRTRGTMTWNNAVRTRGVLTHRDVFLKPACVERGLVRTGHRRRETGAGKQEDRETQAAGERFSPPEFAQDGEGTDVEAAVGVEA